MRTGWRWAFGVWGLSALGKGVAGATHPKGLTPKAILPLLFAVLTVPLAGQPADVLEVTLIEVPVTVVDRDGVPVRGLTAANFEVLDEGKKRQITHFEAVDVAARARVATTTAGPQDELDRPYMRNFLLLFDTSDSTPGTLGRARAAALEFVTKQALPSDRIAVGTIGIERGFELLANFTLDREFVRAVVSTLGDPRQFRPNDPLLLAAADFDVSAQHGGQLPGTIDVKRNQRDAEAAEHAADLAREQRKSAREEQRHLIQRRIANLADLGRVLDRIAGRKQVILLSQGFDARALQGREQLSTQEAEKERLAVVRGQVWDVDTEARYGSSDTLNSLARMVETLKRSDVVLSAVDIGGLRSNVNAETGHAPSSTESLSLLTRDTGGVVFQHTNDLGANFARLLAQQEVTYVLGFQTTASAPGKFHDLKVRLVNGPSGARLSHRKGYYEHSRATVNLDLTFTAAEILTNAIPVNDVKVRAFTASFPHRQNVAQAPVVLEIDGVSLLEGATGKNVPAEIYIYAFDEDGVARDFAVERVGLDLTKLRGKLQSKGMKFYHTLLLPPGDYSVRALVRTEGGRSGFAMAPLHVATDGEPTVAPALLDPDDGWVMVKARPRAAAPVYPFIAGDNVFVPAVRAVLESGKPYELALMTYHVPLDDLKLAAQIEGSGGSQPAPLTLLGRTTRDDTGGVKVMFQLTPPKLARGEYRLVMTMRAGDNVPERTMMVPFEVR